MVRWWDDLEQRATVLRPANGLTATAIIKLDERFHACDLRNLRCCVEGATLDGKPSLVANGISIMNMDEFVLRFSANNKPMHAHMLTNMEMRVAVRFASHGWFSCAPMQATVTVAARGSKPQERATSGAVEQTLHSAIYQNGILVFR